MFYDMKTFSLFRLCIFLLFGHSCLIEIYSTFQYFLTRGYWIYILRFFGLIKLFNVPRSYFSTHSCLIHIYSTFQYCWDKTPFLRVSNQLFINLCILSRWTFLINFILMLIFNCFFSNAQFLFSTSIDWYQP